MVFEQHKDGIFISFYLISFRDLLMFSAILMKIIVKDSVKRVKYFTLNVI